MQHSHTLAQQIHCVLLFSLPVQHFFAPDSVPTVYFRLACPEEIKMGVGLVCASNHCCIHLKWVSFSSGYLHKQGQLPFLSLLDKQPEIHCTQHFLYSCIPFRYIFVSNTYKLFKSRHRSLSLSLSLSL